MATAKVDPWGILQAGESCKVNSLNNEKCVSRITSNRRWSSTVCAGVQQSHGVSSCFSFLVLPYINELARQVQDPPGLQAYTFPSKMTLHGHLQDSHSQNAQLPWPALITWYFPNFKEGRKCIYFYSLTWEPEEKEEYHKHCSRLVVCYLWRALAH